VGLKAHAFTGTSKAEDIAPTALRWPRKSRSSHRLLRPTLSPELQRQRVSAPRALRWPRKPRSSHGLLRLTLSPELRMQRCRAYSARDSTAPYHRLTERGPSDGARARRMALIAPSISAGHDISCPYEITSRRFWPRCRSRKTPDGSWRGVFSCQGAVRLSLGESDEIFSSLIHWQICRGAPTVLPVSIGPERATCTFSVICDERNAGSYSTSVRGTSCFRNWAAAIKRIPPMSVAMAAVDME